MPSIETAAANILPAADRLAKLTSDNPVQVENYARLRKAIEQRLSEFARGIDRVKNKDVATSVTVLRNGTATDAVQAIAETARDMRAEEDRLFAMRTTNADRTQVLASSVTIAGSGLVIALAGISIFLVRRSVARPRRSRGKAARQQSQSGDHGRRAHRGPARSQ